MAPCGAQPQLFCIALVGGVLAVGGSAPPPPQQCTSADQEACLGDVKGSVLLQKERRMSPSQITLAGDIDQEMGGPRCKSTCAKKVARGKYTWDYLCSLNPCKLCAECSPTTTATTTVTEWQSPYFVMPCSGTPALTTTSMTLADYDAIVAAVQGAYNGLPQSCNATYCPQADWAGCVLRLAGHDFMDFKDGEGGSDGCIDLHDEDNAGLAECLQGGVDLYDQFCTHVSLADFIVIAAEAMMNITRQHVLDDDPGREAIDFRSQFKYGRTTALNCEFALGRLPNPENSCTAVKETFVTSMGLSWTQAAALMGVHTLGRARVENSGYSGWWSDAVNSRKFNNDYYISLLLKGWAPELAVAGNSAKNQWMRVDQGVDEATHGKEMMLNTDLCLFFTMDDEGAQELDAATAIENDCNCTWSSATRLQSAKALYNGGLFCGTDDIPGPSDFPRQRSICCGEQFDTPSSAHIDCGLVIEPKGPAAGDIRSFANDEGKWVRRFLSAWTAATTNGQTSLKKLRS